MRRAAWRAIAIAGVAAGVVATLVQIALWAVFTDGLPAILYRDARLTAALVLGPGVLTDGSGFDARVMLVAAAVHFALSLGFAAALAALLVHRRSGPVVFTGAAFGIALYLVNLHAMTSLFPWFDVARGAITLAAHVAFGVTAAVTYRAAR